jgi:hypothetical protein
MDKSDPNASPRETNESDEHAAASMIRVAVIKYGLPGLASIIVAAISSYFAILPVLRAADTKKIRQLTEEVDRLSPGEPGATKTMTITGTVRSENRAQLLIGYDVYLLPETYPLRSARTDDNGRFTLEALPSGDTYSIIVRDGRDGKSGKALLEADGGEATMKGAIVAYRIKR